MFLGSRQAGGALVSAVQDPAATIATGAVPPGARSFFFVVAPDRTELVALAHRIEAGRLPPIIGRVVPLAEGRMAFETKHRGGVPGTIVLAVTDEPGQTRADDRGAFRPYDA